MSRVNTAEQPYDSFEFSEELLTNLMAHTRVKLDSGDTNITTKFDSKGTLHIISRADDGKLLKDVPISESNKIEVKKDLENGKDDYILQKIETLHKHNVITNIIFYVLLAVLIGGFIGTMLIIKHLGG